MQAKKQNHFAKSQYSRPASSDHGQFWKFYPKCSTRKNFFQIFVFLIKIDFRDSSLYIGVNKAEETESLKVVR